MKMTPTSWLELTPSKLLLPLLILLTLDSLLLPVYAVSSQFVTCNSVVKLVNQAYKSRLHSQDVKYGSGSGQQSVTGVETKDSGSSYWRVKGGTKKRCDRGEMVTCGATIRLEHVSTKTNLHSHLFASPLSRNQEVSTFGTDGEGDTGDNWRVICEGEFWRRGDDVMFQHSDTNVYLGATGNTYGRPIHGHMEIAGLRQPSTQTKWETQEGLYVLKSDFNPFTAGGGAKDHSSLHDEL